MLAEAGYWLACGVMWQLDHWGEKAQRWLGLGAPIFFLAWYADELRMWFAGYVWEGWR
jgi:hypothetical protein